MNNFNYELKCICESHPEHCELCKSLLEEYLKEEFDYNF